ncbi:MULTISPECIES: thiosulfohydrolase SoxB [unclassified Meiothermus]|uniref:thiosulfohydrolase SoxB n=1 Tax=unclassified Meiothermus TaxID=370471 RepID=UPI000D7CA1BC|nr:MULTISPECIES: thiosulfohydrolase SoxB [unclassified Meiothermus]PZA05968.1 thiosulfohydrolase SoxB [Meiothermus sp. Pnk-1]RYM27539.1 thiosulfohydrolase SoxB [Meiothermus sp. PNK-Is4]
MTRRELIGLLLALGLSSPKALAQALEKPEGLYDLPPYGDFTLLYLTDLHGQLRPHHYMEPPNLLAPRPLLGQPGYLSGMAFLRYYGIQPGSPLAYLGSYVDLAALAERFGPIGGAPQITQLIRSQKEAAQGPVLVLDGGDNWTNSGPSLRTRGEALVDWMNLSGFQHMVYHWEYTLGRARVEELEKKLKAQVLSYNTTDDAFGDPVYPAYALYPAGRYTVGVIGLTYPYIKVSHPEEFSEGLSFGIKEQALQKTVDELRAKKVDAVVLLSHGGLPLDMALAQRIRGIDLILSGHTHDLTPVRLRVGKTFIVAGGSGGKVLSRIDLALVRGGIANLRLRLLPVFSRVLPEDPEAKALVERVYRENPDLLEPIAQVESLLYKRDTLYSTLDELACRAIEAHYPEAEVIFSPGTRWGTTLLPGEALTLDRILAYTGFTYPEVYVFKLRGEQIKGLLEDVAANVFTPDPFYQQGGDMSRTYGISYTLDIDAPLGKRIRELEVRGRPLEPSREYRVAAYGGRLQRLGTPVEGLTPRPVYELIVEYAGQTGRVHLPPRPNVRVPERNYHLPGGSG